MTKLSCALLVALLMLQAPLPASAADERAFLEALRARGYFDLATEYIAELGKSDGISAIDKAALPYEEALTFIGQSRLESDHAMRMNLLNRSRERLEVFIKTSPQHPLSASAGLQLGTVLAERGQTALARARQTGASAGEKDHALVEARQFFKQGEKIYADSEKRFADALAALPKSFENDVRAQRQELRDMLLRTQLLTVELMFQHSRAFDAGSKDAKIILAAAVDRAQAISIDNPNNLGGFMARKLEGQCYQALGDLKRATGAYDELSALPADEPQYASLRTEALLLTLQCMTDPSQKRFVEAVERGRLWLKEARSSERDSREGLAVQYYTALALQKNAETLKREEEGRKKEQLAEARRYATVVARAPGEFQSDAADLLKSVGGKDLSELDPTTFTIAFQRGKDAYEAMQAAQNALRSAAASDPNIAKLRNDVQTARADAIQAIQRAMELRDEKTDNEEINAARLYLCSLHYLTGDYYDAAVIGEFIGQFYPKSPIARQAAMIALASNIRSFESTPSEARDFERQRLIDSAKNIADAWPGQQEADEAWSVLMRLAIAENDIPRIIECLNKIPEQSPRRGAANLQAGHALRIAYAEEAKKPKEERLPAAKLADLQRLARETIERGLKQQEEQIAAGAEISSALIAAQLSLAQIYLATGQADDAIRILTAPKIGAVTLADARHPIINPANEADIHKVALRAFINAGALDKAEAVMNKLEASVGSDEKKADLLTEFYVAVGRDLEEQLKILQGTNKPAEHKKLTDGFDRFLDRVASRSKGQSYRSMSWVAAMYLSLAQGSDDELKSSAPPQAAGYYTKAIEAYGKILAAIKTDPGFLPGNPAQQNAIRLSILMNMAKCYRRTGVPDKAIEMLKLVLAEKQMNLEAQKEAAYTYQQWGQTDHLQYKNAIMGAAPQKSRGNLILGWNQLANKLQTIPKFNADFHEARYNQALCLYEFALQSKDPEAKFESLERAESTIIQTAILHTKLGGPAMTKKYEALLDRIQDAAGKKKSGLPKPAATEEAAAAPAAAAAR